MPFREDLSHDRRTHHEQMSDLAFRLWGARGRPLGSPEDDWFLAERLVNEYRQESPFDEFLQRAT